MTLWIHTHTIKLCTQELNTKSKKLDKSNCYVHKPIDHETFNWQERTNDELEYLEKNCSEILKLIYDEQTRRGNEPEEQNP